LWQSEYGNSLWSDPQEEVYSNNDGLDLALDDNQWLVAYRVGSHNGNFDYHFWYRTDTGEWANKHGWRTGTGSELLNDMPSKTTSIGWELDGYSRFYDSDIIYYVITEEE
jgi:hypothetical protein